jgi:glycosyltransferase involved in cell wall biosynthesis
MIHIALNAHLLARSANYRQAGIHRYMYGLISHLPWVDESLRLTVLANHPIKAEDGYSDLPRLETRVSPFDTTHPLKRIVWEQSLQMVALHHLQPDIYHALAFVGPWHVSAPMVVTVYDLSFIRYPEVLTRTRRLYLHHLTQRTCQQARRVIAISQSTAHDLTELLGIDPSKIDVAYPGVSSAFQPLPADEVAIFRHKKSLPARFFLFLGTLEPRKNLPMLIRAYGQLSADERMTCHLVIGGGKGWLYQEIFDTIEGLNLSDTVHVPGYIPIDELAWWYNAAHAFVYPALFEGFGIPIVEALACGRPVLASNISSLPEATGPHAVLLPPHDENAWTEALRQAITAPDTNELQTTRRAWASAFTWRRTAEQTLASYRHILEHE